MDAFQLDALKVLFEQALELPEEDRKAFLEKAFQKEVSLRGELDLLLSNYEQAPAFFDNVAGAVLSHINSDDPFQLVGRTVSHYEITETLGGGGMGVVYKGMDTKLGRTVALKFLPPSLTRDKIARERFVREARAASALDHPNICTIYEIDESEDGQTFISMAFYSGETLKETIARGTLPVAESVPIVRQIAEALARAHEAGIIHRDIKPANVMITDQGRVKLLDFGLAKVQDVTITKLGSTLGTVAYMSPEQARGEAVDHRADIWSLGVVLYEMLAGERPFKGQYDQAVIYSVLNEEPKSLSKIHPTAPPELLHIITMCLEKSRDLRYPAVTDLIVDLEEWDGDRSVDSRTHTRPARRTGSDASASSFRKLFAAPARVKHAWRPRYIALLAVMLASILVLATVAVYQRWGSASRIESIAVIPCSSEVGDAEIDFFCTRLARSLSSRMLAIPGLNPSPYRTVQNIGDKSRNATVVGRELNVDAVLTTIPMLQPSGLFTVDIEVTDVRNGLLIWRNEFNNRSVSDAGLYESIALEVADGLQFHLNSADQEELKNSNAYAEAMEYWDARTLIGLNNAINLFKQILEKDPRNERALSGLSSSYVLLPWYGSTETPASLFAQAKTYAERALQIDESLADPHASLGLIAHYYARDWEEAASEFARAAELDPTSESSRQWFAEHLMIVGRYDEALEQIVAAERVAPTSLVARAVHAWILRSAGRYEEARIQLQETIEKKPDFPLSHYMFGRLHLQLGQYQSAADEFGLAVDYSNGESRYVASLASTLALMGNPEPAEARLAELQEMRDKDIFVPSYEFAVLHTGLGNYALALDYLERALDERSWHVAGMHLDTRLIPLRKNSRYLDLLNRMKLPATVSARFPAS